MHRDYLYARLDAKKQCAITAGIRYSDFMASLPKKPDNMLLLKFDEFCDDITWHKELPLQYMDAQTIAKFPHGNPGSDGEYCWADFQSAACLKQLTDQDMAELIYAAHMQEPLASPFFDALDNAYLYMSHDDDWWTKLYMRNMRDILPVLEHRIHTVLKGRKRKMPPFSEAFAEKLFVLCQEGVLFDVERACDDTDYSQIRFYTVGEVDDAERQHFALDRCRSKYKAHGGSIYYGADGRRVWSF